MPFINRSTLMKYATTKESSTGSTEVIQKSKQDHKTKEKKVSTQSRIGRITMPPRQLTTQVQEAMEVPRYTEYRTGLFKGAFKAISDVTLDSDEKKTKFIHGIGESKDIYRLVVDTSLCKSLDTVGGIPKLAMTIFAKWAEANYITA